MRGSGSPSVVRNLMQQPIILSFNYTKDDYVRVLRFASSQRFWMRHGPVVTFGIVFLMIFGMIVWLSTDFIATVVAASVISLLTAAFGARAVYLLDQYVSGPLLRFSIGRQIKSAPNAIATEVAVRIDDDGLSTETEATRTSIKWDGFIKAVETTSDFLFYTTSRFFHFIPKAAFASPSEISFVRCMARAKLGEKAHF